MAPFTLSPMEGRTFVRQTLVLLLMAIALLVAFPWPAPGNSGFAAGIPSSGATWLYVSSIAALPIVGAVALILRNLASRLLALEFPVALTATAPLLMLNDLSMGFVFKRPFVLDGNILILAGLLGAVAIMRPVVNWRRDKATLCFVVIVALIGFDQFAVLIRSMLLPGADGTFPWSLRAAALTGLPGLLHLPLGAFPGSLLLGLGYIQRKASHDAPSHQFAPIPLGVLLTTAIVFGVLTPAQRRMCSLTLRPERAHRAAC